MSTPVTLVTVFTLQRFFQHRNREDRAGIRLALCLCVSTTDERLEFFCRMGLLAVAFLHWIIFALLIRTDAEAFSDQAPPVISNLCSALLQFFNLS